MGSQLNRRDFVRGAAAGLVGLAAMGRAVMAEEKDAGAAPPKPAAIWPFYAFDNGLGTIPTIEGRVKLLKDLGYVGLEYGLNHSQLPQMLEQLDKHGLALNAVYTTPMLEDPIDPGLAGSIGRMKGRPTRIEVGIRSREFTKPSDPAGDPKGVDLLKRLSDLCGDTGPVISVYPHTGFWTERVDDGVRLARQVGRKNVGTNFNLVHWYWVKEPRPVDVVLQEAAPHLMTVTINNGEKNGRKIAALDEGDYDLVGVMSLVKRIGYTGMVGLQCYSVPGPSEVHLKRSMERWRRLLKEVGVA